MFGPNVTDFGTTFSALPPATIFFSIFFLYSVIVTKKGGNLTHIKNNTIVFSILRTFKSKFFNDAKLLSCVI